MRKGKQEETALEWLFGGSGDPDQESPEGKTLEWTEEEREAIKAYKISEGKRMGEEQRSDSESNATQSSAQKAFADQQASKRNASAGPRKRGVLGLPLTRSDLARAVLLTEVLGQPRSKSPWRGNRER